MVISSQPRRASWLSDLLRHRTAKELRLHLNLLVATQRLQLNLFVLHCTDISTVASRRSAYTANNTNILDLDSFCAGLFPCAWSKETQVEIAINATKCTCPESTEHCYFSISMIDLT